MKDEEIKEANIVLKGMCKEYELLAKYNGGLDYKRWKALEIAIKALSKQKEGVNKDDTMV